MITLIDTIDVQGLGLDRLCLSRCARQPVEGGKRRNILGVGFFSGGKFILRFIRCSDRLRRFGCGIADHHTARNGFQRHRPDTGRAFDHRLQIFEIHKFVIGRELGVLTGDIAVIVDHARHQIEWVVKSLEYARKGAE